MSLCPPYAPFFGFAGVASAVPVGAAFGTAKAGIGIAGLGTFKPELIMKSLIPVVMSGIIAVYGLVVSVLISSALTPASYPSCVRAYVHESKVFVSMVLILIFAEVLGLYGLIVALIMNSKVTGLEVC
ncbi:V-type ATPase [Hymenopellis radicata]|nr:V-type ATPase [Hymenopellis radicata]